jgi:hypothetical protein
MGFHDGTLPVNEPETLTGVCGVGDSGDRWAGSGRTFYQELVGKDGKHDAA